MTADNEQWVDPYDTWLDEVAAEYANREDDPGPRRDTKSVDLFQSVLDWARELELNISAIYLQSGDVVLNDIQSFVAASGGECKVEKLDGINCHRWEARTTIPGVTAVYHDFGKGARS
ncbi:MAG: hypothetical protein HOP09_14510 [Hyphomicrobium sp.]|nr:hypothetical protein [Hyphomicrobium sp.]